MKETPETNEVIEKAKKRYKELEDFINQKKSEIASHETEMSALKTYLTSMGVIRKRRVEKEPGVEKVKGKRGRKKKEVPVQ